MEFIYDNQKYEEVISGSKKDISKCKFFSGHFGFGFNKNLSKEVSCITMLRDPIERVISNMDYRLQQAHLKTIYPEKKFSDFSKNITINDIFITPDIQKRLVSNNISQCIAQVISDNELKSDVFESYLDSSLYNTIFRNIQTNYLGLEVKSEKIIDFFSNYEVNFPFNLMLISPIWLSKFISDKETLESAKKNVSEFEFVGIVEKMEESIQLLHYTFGWKPKIEIPRVNVTKEKTTQEKLSQSCLNKISNCNRLDIKLYEFGKSIFESRYSKMVKDLKQKFFEPHFSKLPINDQINKMLELNYESHLSKEKNNESINYRFSNKMSNGSGWHQREVLPDETVFRWTGPERISTIDFSINPNKEYRVQFDILWWLKMDILASLELKINEKIIPIKIIEKQKNKTTFEGILSKVICTNNKKFVRLTFTINKTISPKSIYSDSSDSRLIGLAFSGIKITPIGNKT
jgi:hypothetical protein